MAKIIPKIWFDIDEHGKLHIAPESQAHFGQQCLDLKGKRGFLTLQLPSKKRSLAENNYFHGVVLPILAEHTGYSEEEIKFQLKLMFLSYTDEKTGLTYARQTSSLATLQMEDFLSNVRQFASEFHGCYIPLPNEATTIRE